MTFSTALLSDSLACLPASGHYRVALSGGLDSCVLLHAMCQLRRQASWSLSAVHVHHGLHADADEWVQFCQELCQQWQVPCDIVHVDAAPVRGESPEATARQLRYEAMAGLMKAQDALLTAHHQHDQAETLLLHLMRGSGVRGLASMASHAAFAQGWLLRPLLDVSRQALQDYAMQHGLDWVEDSSNEDLRYDRNFMRHQILPQLASRWPAVINNLARTAGHMREATALLDEMARADLLAVQTSEHSVIDIAGLCALSPAHRRNLLRLWLRELGLAAPTQSHLQQIETGILHAGVAADPCVMWPGVEVHAYRGKLYAMPALGSIDPELDVDISCEAGAGITVDGIGHLQFVMATGQGLSPTSLCGGRLHIRLRTGSERIQPVRRAHRHSLKKLFQEAGVPPWLRPRTPILYHNDDIAAVADLCVCEPYAAGADEQGLVLSWDRQFSE